MRDVKKTSFERENSSRRIRRRRRHMGLYGFVVMIFVLAIGITISCTFLFNINKIEVEGDFIKYDSNTIIENSKVKLGDNLIRLDCDEIEQNILELRYIENVSVRRSLPTTLKITFEECFPVFNINYELGTLLISGKGKILENVSTPNENLPTFYGYAPANLKCGDMIDTEDDNKREILNEFIDIIYSNEKTDVIKSVDITNISDIIITFRDGNIFKMGNANEFEYKLSLAERVIEEVEGEIGYITMIGTNQCSFRTTDGSFTSSVVEPVTDVTATESTTSENEDSEDNEENSETETQTEYIDPDEQMFREHDERVFGTTQSTEENQEDYEDYYEE